MHGEAEHTVELIELGDGLAEVARARAFVADRLEWWSLGRLMLDASLVASELVSNAVIHARSPVELRLRQLERGVRIEVRDGAEYGIDAHVPAGEERGLGLRVVSRLATRWGVDPVPDGKTVWAELSLDAMAGTATEPELPLAGIAQLPLPDDWPEVALVDVPARLLLAWEAHVRSLMREFALVTTRGRALDDIADDDAVDLVVATLERYWGAMRPVWAQARSAIASAGGRITVRLRLPERVVLDGPRFLEAMESADHLARQGRLLTGPADDELAAFRRWFVHAVVRQVASGSEPERCPFPVVAGEGES